MQKQLKIFSVHWALFSIFCGSTYADVLPKPKYGPAGNPRATLLSEDHGYFQSPKHPAPDFWALSPYYIGQFNDQSCSAASLAMVLNAARRKVPKTDGEKLILQEDLVNMVNVEHWKERLSEEGFQKAKGTALDIFAKITEAAFKQYGFPKVKVEVVHVNDLAPSTLAKIHRDLVENEASSDDFIISNFSMKSYLDTGDYGHIAPVGAYDADKQRVLIFDPYRYEYEPYWVDEKIFVQGMNTTGKESSSYRGYLYIHLNSKK